MALFDGKAPEPEIDERPANQTGVGGQTTTVIPSYSPFSSRIVEVLDRETIVVEDSFEQAGIDLEAQDGDYKGTNPRKPLTFNVEFENARLDLLSHYLLTENDNLYLITNTLSVNDQNKLIKLYSEFTADESKENVIVVEEMIDSIEEEVLLVPEDELDTDITFLLEPQFDLEDTQGSFFDNKGTEYKNLNELITTDTNISNQLRTDILSASLDSADLNIDFEHYDNFTVFGSARTKLENAKYKFDKIESLSTLSASLATNSSTGSRAKELNSYHRQIREFKLGFSPYEKYLYNESSSIQSGSEFLGTSRYDASWPKTGAGTFASPYVPITSSNSAFTTWYGSVSDRTGQIYSASTYDDGNENRLVSRLPKYIREDDSNGDFLKFVDMVGEMYDEIYTYIESIPKLYETFDDSKKGYSNDLLQDIGKSFGYDLFNGKDLDDLPKYKYGQYQSGSDSAYTTYSVDSTEDMSKKIQRRLLNNIPYFLKTKGTVKSLRSLVNIFGIPSTILDIREYGGPTLPGQVQTFNIKRKFTKSLDFRGGQHIETLFDNNTLTGRKPDTVEFRFNSVSASNQNLVQALSGSDEKWGISIRDDDTTTDNVAFIDFKLSGSNGFVSMSTSTMPFYDGEFYSVMLSRESGSGGSLATDSGSKAHVTKFTLAAKKYDAGRSVINYSSEVTMSISGSASSSYNDSYSSADTVRIGNRTTNFGDYLSGSMMEFRYWATPLTMSAFNNHVSSPKSYNGNHPSASYTDLLFRLSFDDNKDLSNAANAQLQDKSADIYLTNVTGSAKGFTGNFYASVEDEDKMLVPNVGPKKESNVKVRVISSSLEDGGLSPHIPGFPAKRAEKSLLDTSPTDSQKVGIFFSPTDVIDDDIIRSVADLDFNQYIGDPRDINDVRYRKLHEIRNAYFQKYSSPNSFWDYMRLIKYFDQIIFKQIDKLMPARAKAEYGLVIKQNILERSKQKLTTSMSFEEPNFNGHIDASQYAKDATLILTGSVSDNEGIISGSTEIFNVPSVVKLNYTGSHKGYWGNTYGTASITKGGPEYVFEEVLQPQLTGSRLSAHNLEAKYFYSSSLSASLGVHNKYYAYSSSFNRSTFDTKYDQFSALANLMFEGCKQTNKTTVLNSYSSDFNPVETNDTTPLRIVSQEPGKSKLRIE